MEQHEFFNQMMNQSKIMMASIKYNNLNSPYDTVLNQSRSVYNNLQPNIGRNSGSLRGVDSEFLVPNMIGGVGGIRSIAETTPLDTSLNF